MTNTGDIAVLGEAMIELRPAGPDLVELGVAGDTYNAAVMMSRMGLEVLFLTALGDDAYSARIRAAMAVHGLKTSGIVTLAGRSPGLYAITNNPEGERSFTYWRDTSAARVAFGNPEYLDLMIGKAGRAAHFYWSGITLALMTSECRSRMFTALDEYRASGGRVFFDANYRSALWQGQQDVASWYERAIAAADYVLPSAEDVTAIFGCTTTAAAMEKVIKTGRAIIAMTTTGSVLLHEQQTDEIPLPFTQQVVDTTGAGDAFSGAFAAAIIRGDSPLQAVEVGHLAASRVVQCRGAILPEDAWLDLAPGTVSPTAT